MTVKTISQLKSDVNLALADNTAGEISAADSRASIIDTIDSLNGVAGWGTYVDTEYPDSGSAFTVLADTDTILPNNAGSKIETYKPLDIPSFYTPDSLVFDAEASAFTIGDTVTGGTSGATGVIIHVETDGTDGALFLNSVSGTFTDNETITDPSGGSATANGSNAGGKILGRNGDSLDSMLYFKAVPSAVSQWIDVWVDIGGSIGELYRQTFTFPKGSGTERGILYALPSAYTLGTWQANGGSIYVRSDASVDIYDINFNFDRCYKNIT